MKNWIVGLACFVPMIAIADLVVDVRDDDPGFMQAVPASEIDIVKVLVFDDPPSSWMAERDGFSWQNILAGQETECRATDRNPCHWPASQSCIDNNGLKPVKRVFGTPNVPFRAIPGGGGSTQVLYHSSHPSGITGNPSPVVSLGKGGCAELGAADWGDAPWSIVLDAEYTAICFDLRFVMPDLVRRQHFKFWRNADGIAEKIGHQDLVGEPGIANMDKRVCWKSTVPFEAVSTWQDGPGVYWMDVSVGDPALSECELATQAMEQACAVDPLR